MRYSCRIQVIYVRMVLKKHEDALLSLLTALFLSMAHITLLYLRKMCLLPLIVANLREALMADIGFWTL